MLCIIGINGGDIVERMYAYLTGRDEDVGLILQGGLQAWVRAGDRE